MKELEEAEEDEKNQDDSDYDPEKRSPRTRGKRKLKAASDSKEEEASSLTGSLVSSPGGGDAVTWEEQEGKHAVRNQAKKLGVIKIKTVKSARRSNKHQEKLRRHDGARPKLVKDQGNLLSEDTNNVEAM